MYALVTGASSGIGREITKQLAKRKLNLIIVARRLDRLQQLKKELEDTYHIEVVAMEYDLSKEEDCTQLFLDCKKYPIGIVINNAGFGKAGWFTEIPLTDELDMIKTNITAVHILTKLFAKRMKHGRILNVASIASFYPTPIMSTYGATKSYVLSLSRSINYELKKQKKDVKVCVLCPGPVDTEFNKVAGADMQLSSISAEKCAKIAIDGLMKGKEIIVPGNQTNLMKHLSKVAPEWISLPLEYYIQSKKLN